jgi:hypothetical protein
VEHRSSDDIRAGTAPSNQSLALSPERARSISVARRYSKKASRKVKKVMHERKRGTLRSGRSGKKVKSRKQAVAIALSQARKSGAKVPRKRGRKKGTSKKSKKK